MSIEVYTFRDAQDREQTFTTQNASEARTHAQEQKLMLIANTYVFDESEVVQDYREREDEDEGNN